jgi:hypothetical protein
MHPHEFGARSRYLREVSRAQGDEAVAEGAARPRAGRRQARAAARARRPRRARPAPLGRGERAVRAAAARRSRRRAPPAAQGDAAAGSRAGRGRCAAHGRGRLDRDAALARPAAAVPAQARRGPALRRLLRREGAGRADAGRAGRAVEAGEGARLRHGRPGARARLRGRDLVAVRLPRSQRPSAGHRDGREGTPGPAPLRHERRLPDDSPAARARARASSAGERRLQGLRPSRARLRPA